MGLTVFSGADYIAEFIPHGFEARRVGNLESIRWTERRGKKTKGDMLLTRYNAHPLYEYFAPAQDLLSLPLFDIHLMAISQNGDGTVCVLVGVKVLSIHDGVSANDLGGAIAVHFQVSRLHPWKPF